MTQEFTGREVAQMIAGGKDAADFECRFVGAKVFKPLDIFTVAVLSSNANTFRRKPKTRTINGFTVPVPLRDALAVEDVYWVENPFVLGGLPGRR